VSIPVIASRSAPLPQGEGMWDFAAVAPTASAFEMSSTMTVSSEAAPKEDVAYKNPSPAQVNHAVNQVNEVFSQRGQNLYASLEKDKETGIHVVKLMDKNTKEIVSQYPSKEIVAIAAAITQYQESKGYLLNVSA